MIKTADHRSAESVFADVAHGNDCRDSFLQVLQDFPCPIGAAVVNDDDFVGYFAEAQFNGEMFDGRGDTSLFIAGRDNDAQEFELGCGSIWGH